MGKLEIPLENQTRWLVMYMQQLLGGKVTNGA